MVCQNSELRNTPRGPHKEIATRNATFQNAARKPSFKNAARNATFQNVARKPSFKTAARNAGRECRSRGARGGVRDRSAGGGVQNRGAGGRSARTGVQSRSAGPTQGGMRGAGARGPGCEGRNTGPERGDRSLSPERESLLPKSALQIRHPKRGAECGGRSGSERETGVHRPEHGTGVRAGVRGSKCEADAGRNARSRGARTGL